jgi:hypothetical protein
MMMAAWSLISIRRTAPASKKKKEFSAHWQKSFSLKWLPNLSVFHSLVATGSAMVPSNQSLSWWVP